MFAGVRYRPTLPWTPTETTLRRARQHLVGINARIAAGTFSFAEEFPDYRHLKEVPRAGSPRTCGQVFDEYLAHCSARVARLDMASVTLSSYRTILDGIWRPELGALRFLDVRYSTLLRIAERAGWGKKTHNNAISVLRRAFKFGYRDHPDRADPTRELKGARIQRKDRSLIDPFSLEDAETLIAALRRDWGDAQANYDELRFFTGLRPSEEVALPVSDYDAVRGTLESDVKKIRATLNSDCPVRRRLNTGGGQNVARPIVRPFELEFASRPQAQTRRFATGFASERDSPVAKSLKTKGKIGGERGIRTLEGLLTLTPLAGVRLRPLGHLSVRGNYQPNQ